MNQHERDIIYHLMKIGLKLTKLITQNYLQQRIIVTLSLYNYPRAILTAQLLNFQLFLRRNENILKNYHHARLRVKRNHFSTEEVALIMNPV